MQMIVYNSKINAYNDTVDKYNKALQKYRTYYAQLGIITN
jgi:hypothetical protein